MIGLFRLWDVAARKCIRVLEGHNSKIWSVAFSPNGRTIASGSEDETIRVWNVDNGACIKVLRGDRPYERMNIAGVIGLTEAQKSTLKSLGAIHSAHNKETRDNIISTKNAELSKDNTNNEEIVKSEDLNQFRLRAKEMIDLERAAEYQNLNTQLKQLKQYEDQELKNKKGVPLSEKALVPVKYRRRERFVARSPS